MYKLDFKDADKISPELRGYVAIAQGLGIISGNNGNFNPTDNLTREQGIIVVYNMLNLQE
ncbi:S-layer homology domain-containing protein [Gottschalkia purinilytica]|uniref:S-layer homology domain-containing protein n=1 Tax=Gottschalkia purinilytica TaxID=1503 RepID=UPI003BEF2626